jgi:hypothetical protein
VCSNFNFRERVKGWLKPEIMVEKRVKVNYVKEIRQESKTIGLTERKFDSLLDHYFRLQPTLNTFPKVKVATHNKRSYLFKHQLRTLTNSLPYLPYLLEVNRKPTLDNPR